MRFPNKGQIRRLLLCTVQLGGGKLLQGEQPAEQS